ncbi:hypothetical protein YC2023_040336 [Brassica napus]
MRTLKPTPQFHNAFIYRRKLKTKKLIFQRIGKLSFQRSWKLPKHLKVSAPTLSQVNVKKEPDVPEVLDDKSVTEVLEVHAPSEVSGVKVSKESDVPEVLED